MPLQWFYEGGQNDQTGFVKANENPVIRTDAEQDEDSDSVMVAGYVFHPDISVVSDQEGDGRMVSFTHGPHVSFGPDPGDGSEGGILIFNRLSWKGTDTDPITLIGDPFLATQERVAFFPIACLSYIPDPE